MSQSNDKKNAPHSKFIHAVGGGCSGMVSALVLAPLDTVKTRLILQKNTRTTPAQQRFGVLGIARHMVITEKGGLRALYRGLGTSMIGYVPNWAIYFTTYEYCKENTNNNTMISAVIAGFITSVATSPMWVIKTRMQTQTHQSRVYDHTWHALRHIVKHEGFSALYNGLAPSLFGLIHVGIQFPCYEYLKTADLDHLLRGTPDHPHQVEHFQNENLTWQRVLFASVISKVVASVVAYPHEVLRSRLQDHVHHHGYRNMFHAINEIHTHEGLRGFYNGMGTNLLRVVPAALITLVVYEMSVKYLAMMDYSSTK